MRYTYENIAELIRASRAPCVNASNVEYLSNRAGPGFICSDRPNVRSYSEANEALSAPLFPAGVERVERLAAQIVAPSPQSIKRRLTRCDAGDDCDMSRVWNGDLETAWSRAKRQRTVSVARVLIHVHMSANALVKSETLAWRGVAGLALCEAVSVAGYTVEMKAATNALLTDGARTPYTLEVVTKGAAEPIDLHKAASLLASTLLFRGVVFQHLIAHASRHVTSGLGTEAGHVEIDGAGFDHVAQVTADVDTAKAAGAWVAAQVAILDALNGA